MSKINKETFNGRYEYVAWRSRVDPYRSASKWREPKGYPCVVVWHWTMNNAYGNEELSYNFVTYDDVMSRKEIDR